MSEVAKLLAERHAICDALGIDSDEDAANPAGFAVRLVAERDALRDTCTVLRAALRDTIALNVSADTHVAHRFSCPKSAARHSCNCDTRGAGACPIHEPCNCDYAARAEQVRRLALWRQLAEE